MRVTVIRKPKPRVSSYYSLHTHSRFSVNDALPSVKDLVAGAAALGHQAIALTDHGNMAGTVQLYQECKKAGIKAMPGSEMYLVESRDDKKAKRYHFGLVAYTTAGYRNLVYISTMSHRNFYNKPILDLDDLASLSAAGRTQGLALTTGCYFGLVVQRLVNDGYDAALATVAMFASWFNTYVELQAHGIDHGEAMPEQEIVANLVKIAAQLNLLCVVTQDSHYVNEQDKENHEALKRLVAFGPDTDDAVFPGDSFHLATGDFVASHFTTEAFNLGMDGLDDIHSRYDLTIPEMEGYHYQVPQIYNDAQSELAAAMKSIKMTARSRHRVNEELEVVAASGMADYLLFVARVCQWLREEGIFYQIRGSAGGSLICYLLKITNVNPIYYKLRFDRFLSKDRLSPPDIDIDVEHSRRGDVIEWLGVHYAVVQIGNYRVYSISGEEGSQTGSLRVRAMARLRATTGQADWDSISVQQRNQMTALSDLELYSGYGIHAAGLVVATDSKTIESMAPLMWVANSKTLVTQYDGKDVEKIGLVKLDVLGVKTLTVLRKTMENLGIETKGGMETCLSTLITTASPQTFTMLSKGDTGGVFQLEGGTATRHIRRLRPTRVADLIASVALFRPGVMSSGAMDDFLARKAGEAKVPARHKVIDDVTAETYGILLYQDQVIDILRTLGMPADDLTAFLKAVKASNKNVAAAAVIMKHYEPIVMDMCRAVGFTQTDIDWLWDAFAAFSNYSFNRSHATIYGLTAYRCAWLAVNKPLEFHAALLNVAATSDPTKERTYIALARRRGLKVLPADVNYSGQSYEVDPKRRGIRKGLMGIKGIGPSAAASISQSRPYTSMDDFAARVDARSVSGVKTWIATKDWNQVNGKLEVLYNHNALTSIGVQQ